MSGLDLITVNEWGAKKPKSSIRVIGMAPGIIFHHTAGHHRELDGNRRVETFEEACQYARDIQDYHMNKNGWIDSGHNFLVTRAGQVLQGRWQTIKAIQTGRMVESAHTPGFNNWIGIEHEHYGNERMTPAQREASAVLQAWIAAMYKRRTVLRVDPHSAHYATACPGNLIEEIPKVKKLAQTILDERSF